MCVCVKADVTIVCLVAYLRVSVSTLWLRKVRHKNERDVKEVNGYACYCVKFPGDVHGNAVHGAFAHAQERMYVCVHPRSTHERGTLWLSNTPSNDAWGYVYVIYGFKNKVGNVAGVYYKCVGVW